MEHEDQVQAILFNLRQEFVLDLDEHVDWIEHQFDTLHKELSEPVMAELKRRIHSLKGSGGTYGLHLLSRVCHHLEDLLEQSTQALNTLQLERLLAGTDLMREIAQRARDQAAPEWGDLARQLSYLEHNSARKSCLVIEPTQLMQQFFQQFMVDHHYDVKVIETGLSALQLLVRQRFDLIISARDPGDIDSQALAAALQASSGPNRSTPIILITARSVHADETQRFAAVLQRDRQLTESLERFLLTLEKGERDNG